MIWKKIFPKFTIGLMVAVMAMLCVGSAVFADDGFAVGGQPYGSWFPKASVGYDSLNPYAKDVADKAMGYGETGVYYYKSHSDWYMNPVARDSGVIVWGTSAKIPVYLSDWYKNNPAYITEWYKTPGSPPDMKPWKDFCAKYGVNY